MPWESQSLALEHRHVLFPHEREAEHQDVRSNTVLLEKAVKEED